MTSEVPSEARATSLSATFFFALNSASFSLFLSLFLSLSSATQKPRWRPLLPPRRPRRRAARSAAAGAGSSSVLGVAFRRRREQVRRIPFARFLLLLAFVDRALSRPRCFMFPITVLGSTMQCRISRSRQRERDEWAFVCMPWNSRFLGESEEDRALQSKGAILFRALPLNPDLLLSLFSPPKTQ